jgi:pimeloyl-ACP methyl ester carboxylesterase
MTGSNWKLLGAVFAGCCLMEAPQPARASPPGKLIPLHDGCKLHIYSEGSGSPAVILHPGTGEFSFDWALVQHKIAKKTQVCSYDRAGYAWSDMSPEFERFGPTAGNLHELLLKAGVKPPYILVGHAMGALYIRDYQRRYSDQVAGMVLVDPTPEEDHMARMFGNTVSLIDMADHDLAAWPVRVFAPSRTTPPPALVATPARAMAPFDRLPRRFQQERRWALDRFVEEVKGLTDQQSLAIMESQRATFIDLYNLRHNPQTALGDLPVVVLSRGLDTTPEIRQMQDQLGHLSRKTRHIVAEKCGTQIHLEDPDLVANAVLSLLKK